MPVTANTTFIRKYSCITGKAHSSRSGAQPKPCCDVPARMPSRRRLRRQSLLVAQTESLSNGGLRLAATAIGRLFEYSTGSMDRRVYALCLLMVGNASRSRVSDSRSPSCSCARKSHLSRRIGLLHWLYRLAVNVRGDAPPQDSTNRLDRATHDPDERNRLTGFDIGAPYLLLEGSIDEKSRRCNSQLPRVPRIFVLHDSRIRPTRLPNIGRSVGDRIAVLHKARNASAANNSRPA